jgi:HAD superfamily phosphoserine phosphatase-like hydrolase
MKLALFDLDNTLLNGDSDFEWAQFLIGKGVLDREVHEATNLAFFEQYKAGTLDIHAFLDFQLAPLARHARAELDAWHREFLATRIRPLISSAARKLVRQHADSGDLLAIVTATNSFVTGPIAREFGIAHLIATIPAQENGRFTGQPRGTALVPRRQDRARRRLARIARPLAGRLRAKLVLQRLAQRPAAAGKGHASGRGRCRCHADPRRHRTRLAAHQPARLSRRSASADFCPVRGLSSRRFGYTPPPANGRERKARHRFRRRGRVVEGTPLLRVHLGKTWIQGSNPCVSASCQVAAASPAPTFELLMSPNPGLSARA